MKHKPNIKNQYNSDKNSRKINKQTRTEGQPVQVTGLSVSVRNDDINYALRKLKKKVQQSGILQTLKEKEHYTKPSIARKRAKAAARARWLSKVKKEQLK